MNPFLKQHRAGAGIRASLAVAVFFLAAGAARAETITMASTTSTEQSGLFSHLLPAFKKASDIDIKVVAVGTGQAIDMAKRGDADVLFVHDTAAEEKFVAEGFSAKRYPVMYNDFVLVGPQADPVGAKGGDIVAALKKIAAANAPLCRAATRAAPTRPSAASGRRPAWPRPGSRCPTSARARATRNAAAAWGRR